MMRCLLHSNFSTASDSSVTNTRKWVWQCSEQLGGDKLWRPGLYSRLPWHQSQRCMSAHLSTALPFLWHWRPSLMLLSGQPYATSRKWLRPKPKSPRGYTERPQCLLLACLQLGNLRQALGLTMDVRCKEGWCLVLDKYCQAPFGRLGLYHVDSPQARPGLSPAQVPACFLLPGEDTVLLCSKSTFQSLWLKGTLWGTTGSFGMVLPLQITSTCLNILPRSGFVFKKNSKSKTRVIWWPHLRWQNNPDSCPFHMPPSSEGWPPPQGAKPNLGILCPHPTYWWSRGDPRAKYGLLPAWPDLPGLNLLL